jgi:multicomponent Na+:H+ antiporter subunit F
MSLVLLGLAALAGLLAVHRLLVGPGAADRVVALDVLFAVAVVVAIAAAMVTRSTAFLDVGIGLALVGFVGTLSWARLIERGAAAAGEGGP